MTRLNLFALLLSFTFLSCNFLENNHQESHQNTEDISSSKETSNTQEQTKKQAEEELSTENEDLFFPEVWIWEYSFGSGANKGEFAAYREPNLNYWLLTKEESYINEEMIEWIILKPNGEILFAYQDPEFNSPKKIATTQWDRKTYSKLPKDWTPMNRTENFGNFDMGFPLLKGEGYYLNKKEYSEPSPIYVASTEADMSPLYAFNNLRMEAQIPISFPEEVPGDKIVLAVSTYYPSMENFFTFKMISPTQYYINTADYER